MSHFHTFQNELQLEGKLQLQTALHIGAGNTGLFGSGHEVVTTQSGLPYIPGSSIKGVLRSLLERISSVDQLPKKGYAPPCISTSESCIERTGDKGIHKLENRRNLTAEAIAQQVATLSCPICHLFGNTMMAGKVQFFDCQVDEDSWMQQFDHRHGIMIDRDRLTVSGNRKYEFDAVPAGTVFHFSVRALNVTETEKVWLLAVLELLRQGDLIVGGKAARGLGKITGVNWTVQERTSENYFATVLKREQDRVDFEQYAQPILARLMEV